ncbi:hypothetical protein M404DRAFT_22408 [Pisolithus tinctorius Marx 270]|uniref:Uncharacterized protein n=1 Tax=Pisolithus tinctorius Marx 270 TaxID=870435 RepID=A0A0C3JJE7_PISTI|nr:hypothetical protein M404DRAFT_22408 [Pisolithus tinctorius Marx 270]
MPPRHSKDAPWFSGYASDLFRYFEEVRSLCECENCFDDQEWVKWVCWYASSEVSDSWYEFIEDQLSWPEFAVAIARLYPRSREWDQQYSRNDLYSLIDSRARREVCTEEELMNYRLYFLDLATYLRVLKQLEADELEDLYLQGFNKEFRSKIPLEFKAERLEEHPKPTGVEVEGLEILTGSPETDRLAYKEVIDSHRAPQHMNHIESKVIARRNWVEEPSRLVIRRKPPEEILRIKMLKHAARVDDLALEMFHGSAVPAIYILFENLSRESTRALSAGYARSRQSDTKNGVNKSDNNNTSASKDDDSAGLRATAMRGWNSHLVETRHEERGFWARRSKGKTDIRDEAQRRPSRSQFEGQRWTTNEWRQQ